MPTPIRRMLPAPGTLKLAICGVVFSLGGVPAMLHAQAPETRADSESPATQCRAPGEIPERSHLNRDRDLPVSITARDMSAPGRTRPMRFSGDVELVRGDQRLQAEELIYDPQGEMVLLPGWLRYTDAVVEMEASGAEYHTGRSTGNFRDVRYYIAGAEGAGHAAIVEMTDPVTARVERFDFTTCDIEDPDWQIKAGRVDLDFEEGTGTARNARLEFKGVPFLYTPWLRFPLDNRRKTGLLYPSVGSSSDNGLDLSIPWYWNIAPNQDATFTPRWIANRGAMLGTEYRFLTRRQGGRIAVDYLPDDDRADRDRYFGHLEYGARLTDGWRAGADIMRASDDRYFIDLGGELNDSAVQFLRSSATVRGQGRRWRLTTLVDTFQVLDEAVAPAQEPYSRLPRVEFEARWPVALGLDLEMHSEAVYFDRSEGVTGARFDLYPELGWRYVRPGGFFHPAVGLRATGWHLDREEPGDETPSRVTPVISVDSGLVFERLTGTGRIQTLEPRAFYLYVPHRDQQDLPRFDTTDLTFGFARLFQTNRFTGPDRQGDANQITLALTSRLLDADDGHSLLDASIGQIYFFEDQRVQLDDTPPDDRRASILVSEVNWRPAHNVLLNVGLQWDPDQQETELVGAGLSFRAANDTQLALGYRFRRNQVDQVDVRMRYPLTANTSLIGRFNYSFEDSRALEILGGLEYESCCWAINATVRRYIRDRESEMRTSFFVELHLKGLGSLGRRPYQLFDN